MDSAQFDLLIETIREYYLMPNSWGTTNCCGGNLHIVLDDFNWDDEDIKYCMGECMQDSDEYGYTLCTMLLELTEAERELLEANYDRYV